VFHGAVDALASRPVSRLSGRVDLAVVGAGIVGLAHAVRAFERGLTVAVVERDDRPSGASVRNFGHGFLTAQSGPALDYALSSRALWLRLADDAGFWAEPTGTLLVARWPEELRVITEFVAGRESDARVLTPDETRAVAPIGEDVIGALWAPLDIPDRRPPRSSADRGLASGTGSPVPLADRCLRGGHRPALDESRRARGGSYRDRRRP
jgi:hypothetical protein